MNIQEQKIKKLCDVVESAIGRRMQTPKDFNFLSEEIFGKIKQHISPTTLKRIWGYLPRPSEPRLTTLNLLAQFVGYDNWETFCKETDNPSPSSSVQPDVNRNNKKKIVFISILLLLIVLAGVIFALSHFMQQTDQLSQENYILKKGQHYDSPDEYLKLFGIVANDSLWGRAIPHHNRMFVWTPEFHNRHWHNDGDSALMMPTITEHWEPDEYEAAPELIATRNKDQYWHYLRINELRITFMKNLVDSGYVFLGVYRMAVSQSDTTRCVWERIADECDITHLDYLEHLRN